MMNQLIPEFDRYRIELRLARRVRFPFEHCGVLRGLMSRALETHRLPPGLIPFACESGRVSYEPGVSYALLVTLVGDDRSLADPLIHGLARVGGTRRQGPAPTLGGNFVVETAERLPAPDLAAQVEALCPEEAVTLRFRSPFRLERPSGLKRRGAGYLNRDCFPAAFFLDRLWRRLFYLQHGRYPEREERQQMVLPEHTQANPDALLWVDVPVRGTEERARPYDLGGARGRVTLEGVPQDWLPLLVAGAYLHVGKSTPYGFGRYSLAGTPGDQDPALHPAQSLLSRAATPAVLQAAYEHVLDSVRAGQQEKPPEGAITPDDPPDDALVRRLARSLTAGRYQPGSLRGFVLRKDDGGVRPLAVPSFQDRVAQRAAIEVLGPAIDTLLEDSSFGYRRGFSRQGAARAIEKAYAEGFRYVLDADIRAFFDEVDWPILFAKLDALYPDEPLGELLRAWVQVPVEFDGRRIEREQGLPQGSPVSPLLANLYLDTFDEALADQDFRLVRFADDFVILTRDLERAREAKDVVQRELGELRLGLNTEETAIRSFDDGFSYLGYLFVRSLVLERPRSTEAENAAVNELHPAGVPAGSWLATVPFERIEALLEGRRPPRQGARLERVPLAVASSLRAGRWPLYVVTPDTRLFLRQGTLAIEPAQGEAREVPIQALSHIVFWGRSRVTVPLLRALAREGVPSFFCRVDGELESIFGPYEEAWPLWLAQAEAASKPDLCQRLGAALVSARLRNLAVIAVRFGWGDASALAASLRSLAREAVNKKTADALRGLEGRGTSLAYQGLAEALPDSWGFTHRARRPPPDPINAMLSFGYSLLHNHCATALLEAGLSPRIGLFHQPRGAHLALASDLMEEFRHLVESVVWTLVRRKQIQPGDFRSSANGFYPALLKREARRVFLDAFERRLMTEATPPGEKEPISYRAFLARQARGLRATVADGAVYEPLVLTG